jgi:hypothetical protein
MASEDSQHLGLLPKVHRLDELRALDETRHREVPSELHQLDDLDELGEVFSLRRSQRVRLEERNDHVAQVSESEDLEVTEILTMVVVPAVDVDLPATEELNHLLQHSPTRCSLNDCEGGLHLPAESHRRTAEDGAAEAAFPIYEPHQPIVGEESFLLIVRTGRIFTSHEHTLKTG